MRLITTLVFICLYHIVIQAQDRILTLKSKDSIANQPRLKASLGANLKLNGYFDVFGGLQDSETFNIGKINVFGTDDSHAFHMDMYQTQVKFETHYIEKDGDKVFAMVEFDFWGGNGRPRLRKAFVESRHWQIGQNWNNFGNEELWPNIMEWEGPPSGTWLRTPHIKYFNTLNNTLWKYEISIEAPINNYTTFGSLEPFLSEVNQVTPDLTLAIKKTFAQDNGHIRLSSVLRNVRYKYLDDVGNFIGYGLSLSGKYSINQDTFQYQFVGGKGITAYMASIAGMGFDGYPNLNGNLSATPSYGGWMSYEHFFTNKFHANVVLGSSFYDFSNTLRFFYDDNLTNEKIVVLAGDINNLHYYGLFNLMYDPFNRMTIGLELDYGGKIVKMDGYINENNVNLEKSRDALRISFGFMFYF